MQTAEERLTELETRMAEHDLLIARLIAFAKTSAKGRVFLKLLGVT